MTPDSVTWAITPPTTVLPPLCFWALHTRAASRARAAPHMLPPAFVDGAGVGLGWKPVCPWVSGGWPPPPSPPIAIVPVAAFRGRRSLLGRPIEAVGVEEVLVVAPGVRRWGTHHPACPLFHRPIAARA